MKRKNTLTGIFVFSFFILTGSVFGQVTPNVTSWPTASSITYGESLASSALTGGEADVAGTFAFQDNTITPDAGTYTATVIFTPTDTGNYTTASSEVNVQVEKATPTVTSWPTASSITYGESLASSALTGGEADVAGTFAFQDNTITPDAGTYAATVIFTPTDTGNYTTASSQVNVQVEKATATVTLSDLVQTYDAGAKEVTVTTVPSGLTVDLTYDGSATAPTNAGTYAVVATVNGTNYQGTATGDLEIQKATATVTLSELLQIYDGTEKPVTVTTIPEGLAVTITYDGSTTIPTNAGTYAVVATVNDTNYIGEENGTLEITTLIINVTADALSKTFGDTDPELTYSFSPTLIGGDTFTGALTRAVGEDVGTYAITQGTLALSTNYTIAFTGADFDITPLEVTVTADALSKIYGDADPELNYSFNPTLIGGDTFTGALTRAAGENVGNYAISQGTLTLSSNYTLSYTGANFEITPATLTITANTITKTVGIEYVFSGTEFTTQGLVNNGVDEVTSVTLTSAGAAASAAIGNYPITINPLSETGVGLENYSIGYIDGNMDVVDKITLVLTGIIAESKVYDGTTDVIISNYGTLTGVADGDDVSIDELLVTASFDNKNAGTGKTVTLSNIILIGADAEKYTISDQTAQADITARTLTLSNFTADDKDYDGTTDVTGDGFADDRITGDDLTFTWDVAFADANVGIGKTVNYTNITISGGTDQLNYTLAATTGTTTADITPLGIAVAANAISKIYGDTDPVLTYTHDPELVGGDSFTGVLVRAAGENVGNYAISQGTLALSSNYTLSFTGAIFEITRASLTITANDITKTEGQEFVFAGTEFTTSVLVAGDEVTSATITSAGAPTSALPGTYPIVISDAVGTGLGNYNITYVNGIFTVEEDPDAPETLTINLGEGFTWFSINLDPGNLSLNSLLSDLSPCPSDRVIGQTSFSTYFGTQWIGTLTSIDVNRGYVMELCSSQQLEVSGIPLPSMELNLGAGFTWMGYTPQECLPINEALANISPAPASGDRFIGQNRFSTYFGGQWIGTLTQLCPGNRYTFALTNPSVFRYPDNLDKTGDYHDKITVENSEFLDLNMRNTMTIIGQLKDFNGMVSLNENDIVYAVSGDQERGIARPMSAHNGLLFLSVASNSNEGELISFKVWSDEMQQYIVLDETITFESLKHTGTVDNPFIFNMTEPLGTSDVYNQNILVGDPYPNPTKGIINIPYFISAPADINFYLYSSTGNMVNKLTIYQEIPGNHKLTMDEGSLHPGVYYYKIIITGNRNATNKNGTIVIVK